MDFFSAAEIISSGLNAERTLINTSASNLANAQTSGYKRIDPVFEAKSFDASLNQAMGVEVTDIKKDTSPQKMTYDPSHPRANAQGYVEMPNVNMVEEMVNMMQASRAYEAGVRAMSTLGGMAQKAIGIGK